MDIATLENHAEIQIMGEDAWEIAQNIVYNVEQYDLSKILLTGDKPLRYIYEVMEVYRKDFTQMNMKDWLNFRPKHFFNLPKEKNMLVRYVPNYSGNIFVIGAKEKDIQWYTTYDPQRKILTTDKKRDQWFLEDLDKIIKKLKLDIMILKNRKKKIQTNIKKAKGLLD